MKQVTVRELGGEIWAEIEMDRMRANEGESDIYGSFNYETLNHIVDILMVVLARHVGSIIENDTDLPVDTVREKN